MSRAQKISIEDVYAELMAVSEHISKGDHNGAVHKRFDKALISIESFLQVMKNFGIIHQDENEFEK